MRVALIHPVVLPVAHYGGTERVIWWLAKALFELGVKPTLVALPGTTCPYAEVEPFDFHDYQTLIHSKKFDVLHFFSTPPFEPEIPYVVTLGGNGKPGEIYLKNTVFVSKNHAERHHSNSYVYNGVDPTDYEFRASKENYLVFCAKAKWKAKNVKGAIRAALNTKQTLKIIGGSRWYEWRRSIQWLGMLGGKEKSSLLAGAKGLLFPVIWNEPFGLAVIESLVSGTPVIASRRGSLPDLLSEDVGVLCDSNADLVRGIESLPYFSATRCRDYALSRFHYHQTALGYLATYEKVLGGQPLNTKLPFATEPSPHWLPLQS